MIKSLKNGAIALIIISILCFFGGVGLSKLAEANRGSKVSSGFMDENGTFVVTNEGFIGANKEKEENAVAGSVFLYVLSGIFMISGIGMGIYSKKMNSTDTIRKRGVIIEKQQGSYVSVIVDFDDGSRMKLAVEPSLIVAQGDRGMIGYKGNSLVEFYKYQ